MPDFPGMPLTETEIQFLSELAKENARFMIVGVGSAVLQGADVVTRDLDLWFDYNEGPKIEKAARAVGATHYWRGNPPEIAGPGIESLDLVYHCDGLGRFAEEYKNAIEIPFEGLTLKLLPLDRIIVSKKAAGRPKDIAVLPALQATLASLGEKP